MISTILGPSTLNPLLRQHLSFDPPSFSKQAAQVLQVAGLKIQPAIAGRQHSRPLLRSGGWGASHTRIVKRKPSQCSARNMQYLPE